MHPDPRRPDFEASDASLIGSTAAFLIALTPADKRRPRRANDVKEFVRLKDARAGNRANGAIIARRGRSLNTSPRLRRSAHQYHSAAPQTTNLGVRVRSISRSVETIRFSLGFNLRKIFRLSVAQPKKSRVEWHLEFADPANLLV